MIDQVEGHIKAMESGGKKIVVTITDIWHYRLSDHRRGGIFPA